MAACAASSIAFRASVAPRAVAARKTRTVAAARAGVVSCNAQVEKVNVNDVKDHLDRGFVIVDIRDPDECAATGYKSSWKNIVVRSSHIFCLFATGMGEGREGEDGNTSKTR